MFKRVARRQERQERDEEMGLDAETKEVLGLHDTDSDESSSSSGSEDDSDAGEDDDAESADEKDGDEDGDEGASEQDEESEGDADSDNASEVSDAGEPPLSVSEALKDPLYFISLEPEVRACVACPGKLLKNSTMCEVHRSSNAHVRRYKRFVELAQPAGPETDVRDIVSLLSAGTGAEKSADTELSKRAEKRQNKLAKVKAKRTKQKLMKARGIAFKKDRAAKASAPDSEGEGEAKPAAPAKKRKLEAGADGQLTGGQPRSTKKAATSPVESTNSPPQVKKGKAERKAQNAEVVVSSPPSPNDEPSHPLPSKPPKNAKRTKGSFPNASDSTRQASKGPGKPSVPSIGKKRKRIQKDSAA
ncbi:uncharacterized protein B0H18DRAFT_159283 [Fomitopsis serialis]|uniref:uncharacterized protein n=1 Tax=Fomitopsis serialis TaxID=139415 RepID=UPI00200771FC|nr:uncharacterized protein B0H18DRAFT_159283 [Neoantrodia serialis]KAH9930022.1 hypothetical protein B0H18DRAFT_159283 [Neoantrodia serialis]